MPVTRTITLGQARVPAPASTTSASFDSMVITFAHGAKKSGYWKHCENYRRFNQTTVSDRYPIPHLHDYPWMDPPFFSKLDLVKAYQHLPTHTSGGWHTKNALVTPFELFVFARMPFSHKNAAQTFQRFMDDILRLHRWSSDRQQKSSQAPNTSTPSIESTPSHCQSSEKLPWSHMSHPPSWQFPSLKR